MIVRVNDRGPFVPGRVVDVSYSAAASLGIIGQGTAKVKLDVVRIARRGELGRRSLLQALLARGISSHADDTNWPEFGPFIFRHVAAAEQADHYLPGRSRFVDESKV